MDRKRRSVEASHFAMVPRPDVSRSAFDVQHTHKTTFDAGWLIPIYVDEVLPGDSHRLSMHALARLATPLTPVMDNLILESFFFFVPNRILWSNWERFMGETEPGSTTEYLTPIVNIAATPVSAGQGGMANYFGICNQADPAGPTIAVSALPFRAYNKIFNEWFRDQDLDASVVENTGDGPDAVTDYLLMRRRKRPDYFTTARPWPAKPSLMSGFGASGLNPLGPGAGLNFMAGAYGAGAPVSGIGITSGVAAGGAVTAGVTGGRTVDFPATYSSAGTAVLLEGQQTSAGANVNYPNVRVLINDIRTANQVQRIMERNARGGTRYAERIRAAFGVISPDARLQRPEYLGGGRTFVNVSAVAQTSATRANDADQPGLLGEQAGIGTAMVQNHGFSQSFTEHGWIIGLVNVRADISYQQGINRMFSRRSLYDFYDPMLDGLGEQAIISREIYADASGSAGTGLGSATGDFSVFGYQERWAEYKYKPNLITGAFQSWQPNTLDFWHFAQDYGSRPVLNAAFIEDDPPVDRVLQVGGIDFHQFLFDGLFDVRKVRPMKMFSIPGLGSGRF